MLKSLDFTPESSGMAKSYLYFIFRKITLAVVGLEEGNEVKGVETSEKALWWSR